MLTSPIITLSLSTPIPTSPPSEALLTHPGCAKKQRPSRGPGDTTWVEDLDHARLQALPYPAWTPEQLPPHLRRKGHSLRSQPVTLTEKELWRDSLGAFLPGGNLWSFSLLPQNTPGVFLLVSQFPFTIIWEHLQIPGSKTPEKQRVVVGL